MKPSAVDEMFPDGVGTFMDDEVVRPFAFFLMF